MSDEPMDAAVVNALAAKLRAFVETLSEAERARPRACLAPAQGMAEGSQVRGYFTQYFGLTSQQSINTVTAGSPPLGGTGGGAMTSDPFSRAALLYVPQ